MPDAAELGECGLEALEVLPVRRDPGRIQAIQDVLTLATHQGRRSDGDSGVRHRVAKSKRMISFSLALSPRLTETRSRAMKPSDS